MTISCTSHWLVLFYNWVVEKHLCCIVSGCGLLNKTVLTAFVRLLLPGFTYTQKTITIVVNTILNCELVVS
jgi:hypothetical protein